MRRKDASPLPICQYNQGVDCTEKIRPCASCGWNPDVQEKRGVLKRRPGTPARNKNLIFTAKWKG